MTDRPSIRDVAHALAALDAITKQLRDATGKDRYEVFREFKRQLAAVEEMIAGL